MTPILAVDENQPEKTAELGRKLLEPPWAGRTLLRTAAFEEMPDLYREADIVVIPSLCSEGTSLSLLEAMASGRAVVASDVGGMTNVVLDGFNGLLVPPRADRLRASVVALVEDADLRRTLGANARADARPGGPPSGGSTAIRCARREARPGDSEGGHWVGRDQRGLG